MFFKDAKFQGKYRILKQWKQKRSEVVFDVFPGANVFEVDRYLTYLLEECHYNQKDNVFYEPISHYKFSVKVFAQITIEYMQEHPEEFKM